MIFNETILHNDLYRDLTYIDGFVEGVERLTGHASFSRR